MTAQSGTHEHLSLPLPLLSKKLVIGDLQIRISPNCTENAFEYGGDTPAASTLRCRRPDCQEICPLNNINGSAVTVLVRDARRFNGQ